MLQSIKLSEVGIGCCYDYYKWDEYNLSKNGEWLNWGSDNLLPNKYIELYDKSGLHQSIVKGTSQLIAGSGVEEKEGVYNPFINTPNLDEDLNSIINKISFDLKLFSGFALNILKSKYDPNKIAQIHHIPLQNLRVKYEMGKVVGYWYSEDWSKKRSKKTFIPKYKIGTTYNSTILFVSTYTPSINPFYPKPDYNGAIKYIELESELSKYQLSLVTNGMTGTMHISFKDGMPTEDEAIQIKQKIQDQLAGAENGGKILITFSDKPESAVEIKPIASPDADKQYQSIYEQVIQNVIIAHRINPAIIGTYPKSNFGVGDIFKDYEVFQTMVVEPYQTLIERTLSNLFKSNGIDSEIKIKELRPLLPENIQQ
jgi:hypothetical protein